MPTLLCQHLLRSRRLQELKGLKEGDDAEDGEAKEEGVTFNVWKKTEQPPPAEPVFDEVTFVPCGNAPCNLVSNVLYMNTPFR